MESGLHAKNTGDKDNHEHFEEYEVVFPEVANVRHIFFETFPILFITMIGSLFAGIVLGGMEQTLEALPGLIAVVPSFLDMRGNIYGALGSRLSTGLHQGIINPEFNKNPNLIHAVSAALTNSVLMSLFLSIAAWMILTWLGFEVMSISVLVSITVVAGFLSGLILTIILLISVFLGFKKGLDPDNIVGPVMTISGDIFSVLLLFLVANMLGGL